MTKDNQKLEVYFPTNQVGAVLTTEDKLDIAVQIIRDSSENAEYYISKYELERGNK